MSSTAIVPYDPHSVPTLVAGAHSRYSPWNWELHTGHGRVRPPSCRLVGKLRAVFRNEIEPIAGLDLLTSGGIGE
jgi:hypothetical protein